MFKQLKIKLAIIAIAIIINDIYIFYANIWGKCDYSTLIQNGKNIGIFQVNLQIWIIEIFFPFTYFPLSWRKDTIDNRM